jgi:hypothetical protein
VPVDPAAAERGNDLLARIPLHLREASEAGEEDGQEPPDC